MGQKGQRQDKKQEGAGQRKGAEGGRTEKQGKRVREQDTGIEQEKEGQGAGHTERKKGNRTGGLD